MPGCPQLRAATQIGEGRTAATAAADIIYCCSSCHTCAAGTVLRGKICCCELFVAQALQYTSRLLHEKQLMLQSSRPTVGEEQLDRMTDDQLQAAAHVNHLERGA